MSQMNKSRAAESNGTGECAFPSPPPRSQYCQPAQYSTINGQRYQYLVQAYGQSRRVASA